MIVSDGYSIEYYRNRNQIVICLPQTYQTVSNTVAMITNRKVDISENELAAILHVVKAMMEVEHSV